MAATHLPSVLASHCSDQMTSEDVTSINMRRTLSLLLHHTFRTNTSAENLNKRADQTSDSQKRGPGQLFYLLYLVLPSLNYFYVMFIFFIYLVLLS